MAHSTCTGPKVSESRFCCGYIACPSYLHEAKPKIIHRDLKLENLMLTLDADDRVVAKLGDFGLHAVLKEPKHAYDTNHKENDGQIEMLSSEASLSRVDLHILDQILTVFL